MHRHTNEAPQTPRPDKPGAQAKADPAEIQMLCPQCQSNRVNVKAVNAIEGGIIKIRGICNNCGHVGELIKSPPLSKGDSGGLK